MIRAEVNGGGFLKSIRNVGDFKRKYTCNNYFINAGDSQPIAWNWNVWSQM